MARNPLVGVKGRVAGHEGHIVRVAVVVRELEDRFRLVGHQVVADGRGRRPVEVVARVGHGEMLEAGWVGEHPGHHVDDLLAVQVDDAEGGPLFDFEGVTVTAGDGMGLAR